MDWSHMAQNESQWLAVHVNEPSDPTKTQDC
jgi:hypothetical protein